MGIIKKPKFESRIPIEYQALSINTITDDLMIEVLNKFPEIQIPKFIDIELERGNISKEKANELKRRATIHGIKEFIKKEKEEFDKSNSVINRFKKSMVYVYESEMNGAISKDEVNFLISALK